MVGKHFSILSMLATTAWFFWNPDGWQFEWEPIVVFIGCLMAYLNFEVRSHSPKTDVTYEPKEEVNPSDIKLFNKFITELPSAGVMDFIRYHDFLGSFDINHLRPLRIVHQEWDNAEHEFIDPELEKIRKLFYVSLETFNFAIAQNTCPNKFGRQAVQTDSEETPERLARWSREAKEINDAANVLYQKHQQMVIAGRRKLPEAIT